MSSAPNAGNRSTPVTSQGSGMRSARVLPSGTVLENRYEIQRVAGRGGMSTVYAARDLRFGQVERMCAVKEMGDNEPDPGTRALSLVNFERESALLATIAHPAVPKIYDYFADGGMIYLVLEYIDGDDLERALSKRKSPFPEDLVLEWAIQICDVLEMLHAYQPAPIIFRDLKPSNIMMRSSGKIALIDFGIARTFQVAQRGTMIGTEGYAPPEQYRGLADARGDIYALGATLHHLVTNSDPRQQTPFTFHERPVRSLNPEITEEFATVISRMVAYHPDQRYQTAYEVRQAFEALLRRTGNQADGPAQHAQVVKVDEPSGAGATSIEVPQPRKLDRRRPSRKRVLRNQRHLEKVSERVAWSTTTGDEVRGSAVSDGESVFIGSYDRHIYCIAPEDGTVRWRFETGRGVVARPGTAEGLVVVGSEDSAVYCLDARTGNMSWQHRTSMPVRSSSCIDEDHVYVGSDDATVYCFDLTSGETIWRQRTWGPVRSSPTVSGSTVMVGGDDGYLYALNKDTGEIIWRRQSGGSVQSEPAAAGGLILTSTRSGFVVAFDAESGNRAWTYHASAPVVSSPRVQNGVVVFGVADGALVALGLDDGQPQWMHRYANQITSTPLLGATTGYIGSIDGACLAFALDSGELVWRHELGGSIVSSPCLGDRVLVVGSTDGRVHGLALADWEILELEDEKASD